MLKLKSECMSIGMIGDVAKGNVAEYLFQRDYDEVRWKAAIESVDAIKCQLSAYQSLLKYQDVIWKYRWTQYLNHSMSAERQNESIEASSAH